MEKFVIEGGVPLSGTVVPAGNKNAALPLLAACLLTDEEVVLHNVPRIRDTEALLVLLEDLGVRITRNGGNTLVLCADDVRKTEVDPALAEHIRASFLVAGPLLARFGEALLPPPGGDVIGRRRLDPHLDAFRALGATVEHGRDIRLLAPDGGLQACDFFMDEPSVMGTENALMAAALTPGTTVIRNAASEPHVQDLARMLIRMGAAIEGVGSNVMLVHGLARLGGCEHHVSPDHIEIASFMALAGVTGGELRIRNCVLQDLRMIRLVFQRLGLRSELDGDDVVVPGRSEARDGARRRRLPGQGRGRAVAAPSPPTSPRSRSRSRPSPRAPCSSSRRCSRTGWCSRTSWSSWGRTSSSATRTARSISGPARLRGQRLESPDIRAGMAMLIAALCADGASEIGNVRQIDRGYERIDERLRGAGRAHRAAGRVASCG